MPAYADGLIEANFDGTSARILLQRPTKKNAINNAMLDGLMAALDDANALDSVHSIVIEGAGEVFSAGRDTKEFTAPASLNDGSLEAVQQSFAKVLNALCESPKPTIAAVRGFAFGGGQAMTLACDFVIAERGARFGNVEMAYGFPAAMNIVLLARHLGRRMGLEIAMTGETYSAERYFQIGLVNRLAEDGDLESEVKAFTDLLDSRTVWSVSRTKATFRVAEDLSMAGGFHVGSQLNQLLMLASQTQPVHSGDSASKDAIKGHKD